MAVCPKCGAEIAEDAKFCASCGYKTESEPPKTEAAPAAKPEVSPDVKENKGAAILAYIFPLTLVTMFASKDSKFARFHLDQSLFCQIAFLCGLFGIKVLGNVFIYFVNIFSGAAAVVISDLLPVFKWLWFAFIVVLLIIGIIFAAQGKTDEIFLYKAFAGLKAKIASKKAEGEVPESDDVKERIICALAYLPPFFFLPLVFFKKDNKFARFHANLALIFNIAVIVLFGIMFLIEVIWDALFFAPTVVFCIVSIFLGIIYNVFYFAAQLLVVLGFLNPAFGKTRTLGFLKNVKIIK